MAFIADNDNLRMFDPERDYELFSDGGGSDGSYRFIVIGSEGKYRFSAHKDWNTLSSEEIEQFLFNRQKIAEIWIVHNWDDHWRPIIGDAMIAHKAGYGFQDPRTSYFVRFGTTGSIYVS